MVDQVNEHGSWLWAFCQALEADGTRQVVDRHGNLWVKLGEYWEGQFSSIRIYLTLPGVVVEHGPIKLVADA